MGLASTFRRLEIMYFPQCAYTPGFICAFKQKVLGLSKEVTPSLFKGLKNSGASKFGVLKKDLEMSDLLSKNDIFQSFFSDFKL